VQCAAGHIARAAVCNGAMNHRRCGRVQICFATARASQGSPSATAIHTPAPLSGRRCLVLPTGGVRLCVRARSFRQRQWRAPALARDRVAAARNLVGAAHRQPVPPSCGPCAGSFHGDSWLCARSPDPVLRVGDCRSLLLACSHLMGCHPEFSDADTGDCGSHRVPPIPGVSGGYARLCGDFCADVDISAALRLDRVRCVTPRWARLVAHGCRRSVGIDGRVLGFGIGRGRQRGRASQPDFLPQGRRCRGPRRSCHRPVAGAGPGSPGGYGA